VTRALPALLLFAACVDVRSDKDSIREMQAEAARNPQPALFDVARRIKEPLDLPGERPAFTLQMQSNRLPSVRGRLNGVGARFLVDTGASHVTLSAPLAKKARTYVPLSEPASAVAPGHKTRIYPAAAKGLELGPIRVPVFQAVVREEQVYTQSLFSSRALYDGVLGAALLSLYRVVFDFKEREIRFEPHDGPGRTDVLFVPVLINGREYHLLVDSGAAGLYIEPWVAQELDLLDDDEAQELRKDADSLTKVRLTRVRVNRLEVDERAFLDIGATVIRTFGAIETKTGRKPAGLLGIAGFGELVWTVAYDRMALKVE
jgi:predicted aspartyl protease